MDKLRSDDIVKLASSVIICMIPAFIAAMINARAIPTWYSFTNRPSLSPPDWVFGPVWTALYILMAVSLFRVWRLGIDSPGVKGAMGVFAVQLLLNGLWTPVFFGLRSPLGGLVVIGLLWVAILITIIRFSALSHTAMLLLIPYLTWVSFAAVLNAQFYMLNK